MSHAEELTELLERGAATPEGSPDPGAMWQRGRRRRTVKRAAAGIGTVGALIVGVTLGSGLIAPQQELDIDPLDEAGVAAPMDLAWSTLVGGPDGVVELRSVAPTPDGGVLISGQFTGSVTLGDRTLVTDGSTAGLALRLDDEGEVVWAEVAGSSNSQGPVQVEPIAATSTAEGELIVTGVMSGDVRFGDIEVAGDQTPEGYTAKIGADGQPVWVTRTGTGAAPPALEPAAITTTADGGVIIVGGVSGTVDFADTTLDAGAGHLIYAVRLDTDGRIVWARSIATSDGAMIPPTGVSSTTDGVIVAGILTGTATFGTRSLEPSGDVEGFVLKVTDEGQHAWVTAIEADDGMVIPQAIDATPDGGAVIVANLRGSANLGGARLEASGVQDGAIFALTADGDIAWATLSEPGPDQVELTDVTVGADGTATATGWFTGPGTFAGVTPERDEYTTPSGLLLRFEADGRPLGTHLISAGTGNFLPAAVTTDSNGNTTIAGTLTGQHTFDDQIVDVGDQTAGIALNLHANGND